MTRFTTRSLRRPLIVAAALASSAALAPPSMAATEMEEIIVTGRAQTFYLETTTSAGSRLELDVLELPQSVQLLPEQLIIDQAARDITDLYRSIAGVSEFSYSGVTFRGFRDSDNVFYDGVRGDPFSGFGVPQIYNIERVEVLKGPSAALYGGGEPGGMINYVTKKPSFDELTEVQLTGGNYNLGGLAAETRGPLTDRVAYRVGGFFERQDEFRDNADSQNQQVAGGLLFEPTEDTRFTATADYIQQDLGGHRLRGVLADDDGNFIVDRSFNTNEKSDFQDLEAVVLQAIVEHRLTDRVAVDATLRYLDNERVQRYHEPRGWVDANGDGVANRDDGVIRREFRDQFRANEELSLTMNLKSELELGGLQHRLLVGGDWFDVESEYDYLRARYEADNVMNLNVFDPDYGKTDPSSYDLTDLGSRPGATTRAGLYVQDYVELGDRWQLMAGLRYDRFEDEDARSGFSFDDSNVSPRLGLVFEPMESASVYYNYSESFNPQSLRDQAETLEERTLDPERGVQHEIGWKQKWAGGAILSTVALYDITKEDVAQANPADTGPGDGRPALLNIGEVESTGFEMTIVGDVTPRLALTANYAYNDTKVARGVTNDSLSNTFGDGTRFVNAPEHQLGLWARYSLPALRSSVAFGADHVSEQFSFSGQRVKPYTVFDASWTTTFNPNLVLQLNVRNLTDEVYAVSGFIERTGHFPGAPREFIAQLRYSF